jgi:AraC-like DNA-binding protein
VPMGRVAQTCQKLLPMPSPVLLYTGSVAPDPRWRMMPHSHPYDEVIVVLGGCVRVHMRGQTFVGRTGDILLYPAGCIHEEISDSKNPLDSIFMGLESPEVRQLPTMLHDDTGRVRQLAHWIYEDRQSAAPAVKAATLSLMESLLAELRRIHTQPVREAVLVASIRDYISQHISEPLTLDRLARHAGLSKFHFSRVYRRLARRAPMADVREIRTGFARDLLLTTNLPLKEIAPRAGFTDEYQLSRLIRKHHRLSPRALRKRARGY